MMVGPSGSGKSKAWQVLLKALERLEGTEGVAHVIDPKVTDLLKLICNNIHITFVLYTFGGVFYMEGQTEKVFINILFWYSNF